MKNIGWSENPKWNKILKIQKVWILPWYGFDMITQKDMDFFIAKNYCQNSCSCHRHLTLQWSQNCSLSLFKPSSGITTKTVFDALCRVSADTSDSYSYL